eukprot:gnl/TRDRNA2_/TRDRNA2_29920_c0_seq1.p1 gnl/TRDRNA2_/TRDRNA2_29920_c0~~gnl/TRDRNA2_/TRDRNA2_29920_c0_seq1.p1  ORF type:complete len:421 (-),score=103.07 gnl/TRDRNA2_/TRDRNA2_29920_c0_seq1:133-1395(-)
MSGSEEIVCYWEKQGADKLCAVHCVNALLQGPHFSAVDLGQAAQELDAAEKALMQEGGMGTKDYQAYIAAGSTNVDATGNFSIGVIEQVLKARGLLCINTQHPDVAGAIRENAPAESGFICNSHAREHWFSIRKVKGVWWDLDSLKHSPTRIGDIFLSEFLNATRQQGFTIFVVRGESLDRLEPLPLQFRGRMQLHQHFLTSRGIEDLKAQGAAKEQREMDEARRLAGGDAGDDDGDHSSAPAYTKVVPADKREKQETDWKKLGSGQRLDGSTGQASHGGEDAELQAALRASMMDNAASSAAGHVPPPEEPPAGTPGVCTLQVRLPNGKRCQRRFLAAEHTVGQIFAWLEHASVEDASLGLPVLTACDAYSLLKRGFPGGQVKIERIGTGVAKISDEEVQNKLMSDAGFAPGQEALTLQL